MNISGDSENAKDRSGSTSQKLPHIPWISDRVFYGWMMVFVGAITQFFQGLSSQGFTAYMGPLERQFGWNKATLSGPRSVTMIENSILGPVEGWLVDRLGPRKVVATGIIIMGGGLILFGLTQNLWIYYASNIIIALGTGLQGLLVMSVAVNNWFRRKRSISQSVMLLGFPMAGVVGLPAIVLVMQTYGWEVSAVGSGLLIWAIGLPCSMLLRTTPEPYGLEPDGYVTSDITDTEKEVSLLEPEYDFTLAEAIRTPAFWFLAAGWGIGNLGIVSIQVHLLPHLEEGVGLEPLVASFVWSVASISNIPCRLLGGFIGDRFPKHIVIGTSMVLMSGAIFILAVAKALPMAMFYAVLYGIGWGVRTPIMNAIQGEYFGRKSQGVIRGWLQTASMPLTPPLIWNSTRLRNPS